jgi:preprotein translocase subunit SecB
MSQPGQSNGDFGPQGQQPLRIQILGQYVKDLSFENPGAPLVNSAARPQIDLGVDLQAKKLDQDRYEVEIKLRVSAQAEQKPLFLLELVYAGLLLIQSAPEEFLQQILLVDVPHLLFPFARRIVADAIRDGGMPPLMIEPIDFGALYRAKAAEGQLRTGPTAMA